MSQRHFLVSAFLMLATLLEPQMVGASDKPTVPSVQSGAAGSMEGGVDPAQPAELARALGVSFPSGSTSTLVLERDGKRYLIDVASRSIRNLAPSTGTPAGPSTAGVHPAAATFQQKCAACHGKDGRGIRAVGTPDFTSPATQSNLTDETMRDAIRHGRAGGKMPAWSGQLNEAQIGDLVAYLRSLGPSSIAAQANAAAPVSATTPTPDQQKPSIYQPGDDLLISLPSGRPTDRHGVYVNFTHRFAYDPAFSGPARGAQLLGLDGYSISSFGFRYGVTDKLSVSAFRSPTIIGRPIQLAVGYSLFDEHEGSPVNLLVRASIEGQDNFRKNFTQNLEAVISRSVTGRAQLYLVPTVSFNDRPLTQIGSSVPNLPGTNAFSLGIGAAVDIRPTVALLAEVIPTLVNGRELGIHRPAYAFGIQKKIWRHAFTLGFTNSPGVTVSQRAGTRAEFLGDPKADKPGGLFIGFDLTRQIH
jgi:mono/diheme cytochrome c family protein